MRKLTITIAGDSGDGIQLLGNAYTDNVAIKNFNFKTLPDFPAEIRAPAGTTHGVSGFQIQYGYDDINTAGYFSDIFIAFNVAGLKKYLKSINPSGIIIYDPSGFDAKNYKLAGFTEGEFNQLPIKKLEVEFSKMTKEALVGFEISDKEKDHNKNIFALGFLDFAIHSNIEKTKAIISEKFKKSKLKDSMLEVLNKGYHYAETIEFSLDLSAEKSAINKESKKENQRNITGNKAIALAILAAPKVFNRNVLFAGYPITPASDILHELAKYKLEELVVRQAEDELAAASMALGASFGGSIGITASSGPGIDLKQEVIGLAHMAEIPLLIINIQRAGPSTGMPTKLEQSDLNLALYGRHGDCPIPVLAIKSPSTAFGTTLKAIEIMIKYQTPVFLLSDALIANGSELWEIPKLASMDLIETINQMPFSRNEDMVRPWTPLGMEGVNYIAGGLEKDAQTGGISYEGDNHQAMTDIRRQKIENISKDISLSYLEQGSSQCGTLIISWGSTYGSVKEAFNLIKEKGLEIAHIHLEWIQPLPANFIELINQYDQLIIPEINSGQLASYLAQFTSIPIKKINQIKGAPFYEVQLAEEIIKFLN
jgi:2-oxoglutarate/2-oxoacid ferredoxin oxidoreductase subunit alpha